MNLPLSRGISIFWQTMAMLIGYMLLVYLVTWALVLTQLRSEPSFIGMAEIAERLSGEVRPSPPRADDPASHAELSRRRTPPIRPEGMIVRRELTADLARRLDARERDVRLYFAPDQRRFSPFPSPGHSDAIPRWRGEALFFDGAVAALAVSGEWRVLTMPRSPRVIEFERRQQLIPAILGLLLIGMAFVFARRLSRPLRHFAASADRLGRLHSADPVPVQGPAELRTAALAINAMQQRIEDMIRERTEMVAAIAHDLRTPLARIAFRVENSADTVREPVLDDIEQMREMIARTLDFARGASDARTIEACDIGALAKEVASSALEMGQEVAVVAQAPHWVRADRLALKRMIQNLVENAINYGHEAAIEVRQVDDRVLIEIADRGPGLPDHMLERVMAPFVRNEPSRNRETGGAGLGLAIAKAIAAKHDGTLALSNRVGGGLIARVSLPKMTDPR